MTTYDILINKNLTYSPVNRWGSNRQPPRCNDITTRSLKKRLSTYKPYKFTIPFNFQLQFFYSIKHQIKDFIKVTFWNLQSVILLLTYLCVKTWPGFGTSDISFSYNNKFSLGHRSMRGEGYKKIPSSIHFSVANLYVNFLICNIYPYLS